MNKLKSVYRTQTYSCFLNLLVPGLGHLFWKEYLFGIFIFLVMFLASILLVISFFITLPNLVVLVFFGLPLVFYIFTFIDLRRTVNSKCQNFSFQLRTVIFFLVVGVVYQLVSPIAPINFGLVNRPDVFFQENNRLSPMFSKGDLLKASRLAYKVDLYLVNRPILHSLPQRYDIVRYNAGSGRRFNGIVIGLPGEQIEVADGVIIVDGMPDLGEAPGGIILTGDCPLTLVDGYSILVATLSLGRIDEVHEVPLLKLVGKVSSLF